MLMLDEINPGIMLPIKLNSGKLRRWGYQQCSIWWITC